MQGGFFVSDEQVTLDPKGSSINDMVIYLDLPLRSLNPMGAWTAFEVDGQTYDLSHFDNFVFNHTRAATGAHPAKTVRFLVSFGHHCFTSHIGDDDKWLYPHVGGKPRYFCPVRSELSREIPRILQALAATNPYLKKTFVQHREEFFHLEHNVNGIDYRLFIEITKVNKPFADIRLKIASAYPEEHYAKPVGYTDTFSFWRVVDARLDGTALPTRKRR